MSIEENKALVQRCFDLWNARDGQAAGETYSVDYVWHGPPGEIHGRDGISGLWGSFIGGFPDLEATVERLIGEGDRVVARWTVRGTHRGDFQGMAPTNRRITLHVLEEFRISDGVLVEAWETWDQLALMQQLGAMPTSPEG